MSLPFIRRKSLSDEEKPLSLQNVRGGEDYSTVNNDNRERI